MTCGAADTGRLLHLAVLPASRRSSTQSRTEHAARHHDHRRQRQRCLHRHRSSAAALPACRPVGQGSPCKDRYGSSFQDTIRNTTYPSLVKALRAVRAKAPTAKVAILGYPWIMPATGGCFGKMPVAKGDVPYVRGIQWTLNDAVRRAAVATGATYVNLNVVSNGHDACQPIGVRWVEPVLQGTNAVIVHPNALGESPDGGPGHEGASPGLKLDV